MTGRTLADFLALPPPPDSARFRTLFRSSISSITSMVTDQDIRHLLGVFFDAILGHYNLRSRIQRFSSALRWAALVRFLILWHSRSRWLLPGNPSIAGSVAFTYPSFRLYQIARFFIVLATEMQSVAVGWQVYEITKQHARSRPRGPVRSFFPAFCCFSFPATPPIATIAAKFSPLGYAGFAVCSALLLAITFPASHSVYPIYGVVVLVGIVRSFNAPASRAILPLLVPEEHFHSAFAWGATIFQAATILGPGGRRLAFTRSSAGRRWCTRRRWWPRRPRLFRCSA